jgi:hypothetical protein
LELQWSKDRKRKLFFFFFFAVTETEKRRNKKEFWEDFFFLDSFFAFAATYKEEDGLLGIKSNSEEEGYEWTEGGAPFYL